MKYPVPGKTMQLQNVEKVFESLQQLGVGLDGIQPADIVDGHREKTLRLLWKMIFAWRVNVSLDADLLTSEINDLKRDFAVKFGRPLADDSFLVRHIHSIEFLKIQDEMYFQSDILSSLLSWARTVCAFSDIPVHNFSSSFADGRALCALLSHYHPNIISLSQLALKEPPKLTAEWAGEGVGEFSPTKIPIHNQSQRNFNLFNARVQAIGGIPILSTVLFL
jgi:abnormal spindle-like microcephaly-associated protein